MSGTERWALVLEYDGSGFSGWQTQSHADSLQGRLEAALARVADRPLEVVCAGRTDAGVHATHQVVHFDSPVDRPPRAWVRGVNSHLPPAMAVRGAWPVPAEFHARFSATSRRYRYVIRTDPVRPALQRQQVSWTRLPLDPAAMQAGAGLLLGEHDFNAFRSAACQARHAVRELRSLQVSAAGRHVYLDVEANAFLHHMVRNLAGVLMAIGAGERPPEWAREVLESRDRRAGGVTAPAEGLYLVAVDYPERFGLPAQGPLPVFA